MHRLLFCIKPLYQPFRLNDLKAASSHAAYLHLERPTRNKGAKKVDIIKPIPKKKQS